jgi:hypothetical protein
VREVLEDIPPLVEGTKRQVATARKNINGILRRIVVAQPRV